MTKHAEMQTRLLLENRKKTYLILGKLVHMLAVTDSVNVCRACDRRVFGHTFTLCMIMLDMLHLL